MMEAAREARRQHEREYWKMRRMKRLGIRPLSVEGDDDLVRVRSRGFEDYGFRSGEAKQLLAYCQDPRRFEEHELLLRAAKTSKREIANLLYFSITNKCSWDQLDKMEYLYIGKGDFYAYRRKTLALFRDTLIACGKWDASRGAELGKEGERIEHGETDE